MPWSWLLSHPGDWKLIHSVRKNARFVVLRAVSVESTVYGT